MKKKVVFFAGILIGLLGLLGYSIYALSIQKGQDTVTRVYQNDVNGTPIVSPSPITLISKAGHRSPFNAGITGYILTSKSPLGTTIPRQNQTIELTYKSAQTATQIRKTLADSRYLSAGTQLVSTPVFNNRQFTGAEQRTVGRISTSPDGLNWDRLPISYPAARLQNPALVYHQGELILLDQKGVYRTSDFVKWQRVKSQFTSSRFRTGQFLTAITAKSGPPVVIVSGKNTQTGQRGYYYGQLATKKFQVTTWHRLNLTLSKSESLVGLNAIGKRMFAVTSSKKQLRLYVGQSLGDKLKHVGSYEKSPKQSITSAGVIRLKNKQYRLSFNRVDHRQFQLGTTYIDLSKQYKKTGKQHQLRTDFMWYRFKISDSKS